MKTREKLACPQCDHRESRVVDSRLCADGKSIRRTRQCERCEARWSTRERFERCLPRPA